MKKHDLLLEIGLEEIPARFILQSIDQLVEKLSNWLHEVKVGYEEIQSYSTPRRLAVIIKNIDESQEDTVLEVKGPAKKIALDQDNNWTKAAIGFTKSQDLTVDDIYFKEIKGVEYVHVKKFEKGQATFDILQGLKGIVESINFPNNMRWGSNSLRYVRPIRWIVALYGDKPIQFTVAGVTSGNVSRGHRFLGKEVKINSPADYVQTLEEEYVIVNYKERQSMIESQINTISKEKQWFIPIDPKLLEEVTNLVEYPTAFYGSFNEEYLKLPEEVLVTSMREHQRYFPVKNNEGKLLPYFIGIRNGNDLHLENVRKGNEKVLRARLADANFFYIEDQKLTIDDSLQKLNNIIYHEKLGTLGEKVDRIIKIASMISEKLSLSEVEQTFVSRASQICKFDLVTNMVDEFPELQGVMGEKYALIQGEQPEIAQAIREHYQPVHPEDPVPQSTIGAVVSLADKMDSIVSTFSIGLIPTGSQDPYALRRQATAVVKILLDKNWGLSLDELIKEVILISAKGNENELFQQLIKFMKQRIHHFLEEKSIRYDIIDAVLDGDIKSVPDVLKRAEILQLHKDESDFKEVIESLARVLNIAEKATEEQDVNPSLFENEFEQQLYDHWNEVKVIFTSNQSAEQRYTSLKSLQPVISNYFDQTMVMADNEELKQNRLSQMKKLAYFIRSFASMNKIVVK